MPDSQRGLLNKESYIDVLPYQEGLLPLESFKTSSHETPNAGSENRRRVWRTELDPVVYPNKPIPLHDGTVTDGDESMDIAAESEEHMKQEMVGDEKTDITSSIKDLTREDVSKCFYMTIVDAAKELNVGVTLLKRRCRELGIQRWPHRKLRSLETVIQNVKKSMGGEEDEGKMVEIRKLEMEKKKIEEAPDMPLEPSTKRLRQNCFKANYKKKMAMSGTGGVRDHHFMVDDATPSVSSPESGAASGSTSVTWSEAFGDDDDDIEYLLYKPDGSF